MEVRDRANEADFARTLVHAYAPARLHFDVDDTERSKREVEAEAVAYVGRYCGFDTSWSAVYLAAWESDDPEVVRDRLGRTSRTARELVEVLEDGGDTLSNYSPPRDDTRFLLGESIDAFRFHLPALPPAMICWPSVGGGRTPQRASDR